MKKKCRSAIYYANNSKAREKKKKYDSKLSSSPEQKKKRVESNKARRLARKKGVDIEGKDYDHFTGRFVPSSINRGRKGEGGR